MTTPRTIPFGRPWIDESDRKSVMEVLDGHILTHGPQCKSFEEEFASFVGETAKCVTVSSCMAALHVAYLELRIGPGDEVLVPALTHAATVHAVEWVGARPIFIDCDKATGNMRPDAMAEAITPKTKAVGLVHFAGIPCDMPRIMEIADAHKLKVIEDCALAVGSRYARKHVALFGDAGCFSFYPVKHITTGEGGMFVSKSADAVESVNKLRAFGVDRTYAQRSIPGYYDVPSLGLNYRMSEMQAALGRSQLARFPENLRIRRSNFQSLKEKLARALGTRILDSAKPEVENSYYCMCVVLEGKLGPLRNEVISRLNAAGIGTSIYYPQPVPRMTYYREKYGYQPDDFPNAEEITDHSIALPVGPHLNSEDMEYIGEIFSSTVQELGK